MTTAYTTLLGLALPVEGELDGTWGDTVNNQITQLVEDSVAGVATQAVTSGDWTLTTTGSGAQNQARCAILIPTGSPGVSRNIIAPSKSKTYVVVNQSDAAVVLKGSATTGTTILSGNSATCAWNGSDFVEVSSGNVDGPSSATDTAIVKFNGTSGKVVQNSGVTIDSSNNVTIPAQGDLRLADSDSSNYVGFQAPATVASNVTWTLPSADGSANQGVTTNGSGTLQFATVVQPSIASTFTALQTFSGSSSAIAAKLVNAKEVVTISATAATGTINYDVTTQSILYYTSDSTANWTINFRASSGTALNDVMSIGESITVVFLATNGATAYYNNSIIIDGGSTVTVKYQSTTWSFGNATAVDAYTYTIIKTASATFTVFASQIKFA